MFEADACRTLKEPHNNKINLRSKFVEIGRPKKIPKDENNIMYFRPRVKSNIQIKQHLDIRFTKEYHYTQFLWGGVVSQNLNFFCILNKRLKQSSQLY